MRLTFPAGQAALSPADEAALKSLAHTIPSLDASSVSVIAHASGKPDDPSTPRRLSLSRGLAVRSVLMDSGIPSNQIYIRALGATGADDGPPDRVDVAVGRIGAVAQ